jgi:hypothetical protein
MVEVCGALEYAESDSLSSAYVITVSGPAQGPEHLFRGSSLDARITAEHLEIVFPVEPGGSRHGASE